MQNGSVESFNARARDELLNAKAFTNLAQFRMVEADWLTDFSDELPHQSLVYRTPSQYAATFNANPPPQLSAA